MEEDDQELAKTEQEEKPEKANDKSLIQAYLEEKKEEREEEEKELDASPNHTIIKRKKYGNHSTE